MNEKQTAATSTTVRPTKKQRELLTFIEGFIIENGYSPSYREIMNGLSYTSVATVALHVNSLIARGHLRKRERNARSLEVVVPSSNAAKVASDQEQASEEKWLIGKIDHAFGRIERAGESAVPEQLDDLYVLVRSLQVLGFEGVAQSFLPRLTELKKGQIAS